MAEVTRQRGPYATILASRLRSQRVYGTSFALDVSASLLFGLIEFVEVWIVFHNVRSFGGLSFDQICLLFGLSHCAYALSQVLVGHVDTLPTFLREGTMEAFYLRPLSLLGQLVTSEIALRRLAWWRSVARRWATGWWSTRSPGRRPPSCCS